MKSFAGLMICLMLIIPYACEASQDSEHDLLVHVASQKPTVIGFGEFHPDEKYTGKTTLERFTEKILPTLANLGYKDIIVEFLFIDIPPEEFRRVDYNNNPAINKNLLLVKDYKGTIMLLEEARRLGVNIHGAWPNENKLFSRVFQTSGQTNVQLLDSLRMVLISRMMVSNIKKKAQNLISAGKKLLIYTGNLHNTADNQVERMNLSYTSLIRKLDAKYLEVQLIVKKLAKDFYGPEDKLRAYLDYTFKKISKAGQQIAVLVWND